MVQVKPNPDYQGWEQEDQDVFIRDARAWIEYKGDSSDVLIWLYRLGCDWNVIRIDYVTFVAKVHGGGIPRYRSIGSSWNWIGSGIFRGARKYVKNKDHQKKQKTSKQIWREYKKINKDRSKCYYSRKRGTFYDNRRLRRHTKQMLQRENYEALSNQYSYERKKFSDWWW